MPTSALIAGMLKSGKNVSDLIFSPGRPPQIEVSGRLMAVKVPGLETLTPADTSRIAADLIGQNKIAAQTLKDEGATDLSYSIPGVGRFRTNIFRQRGTHAIVMRVIASKIPTFEELNLPEELKKIAELKNGIVLVTGPTGSGNRPLWPLLSTSSTRPRPITSSPLKTRSNSCIPTRWRPSTSGSCIWTPSPSRAH